MMEAMQPLDRNPAENYIPRSNSLGCRRIGLPIPNKPILTNPVHKVNEEIGCRAKMYSKLKEE